VTLDTTPPRTKGWSGFVGWTVGGAVVCLTALIFPTLGALLLAAAVIVLISRPPTRRSGFGLAAGAALPLLWVAWNNRVGPGWACTSTPTSTSCDQLYDPVPWLVVGLILIVAGIAGQLATRRR
jgi:hypothetical protein